MNTILLVIALKETCFIISMHKVDIDTVRPTLMIINPEGEIGIEVAPITVTSDDFETLVKGTVHWVFQDRLLPASDYLILVTSFYSIDYYKELIDKCLAGSKIVIAEVEPRVH